MKFNNIDWDKYLSKTRNRDSSINNYGKDPDKHFDRRNEFDSDFGRAVFSSACRRMHDKTQVMPLSNDDNVHSRLTHSLEVMSIAQSLGDNVCRDPEFQKIYEVNYFELERQISAILRTAAIMHDIGNPPFGHFGEHVISKYFEKLFLVEHLISYKKGALKFHKNKDNKFHLNQHQILDFIQYDGNAQGLRVMTKLQYLNDLDGLNLTFATLGAYLKYPNTGLANGSYLKYPNTGLAKKKEYIGKKKHGIYYSENDIFLRIAKECNLNANDKKGNDFIKRHPLSFLVEAADTICYRSMDIEDGWNQNWYNFNDIIERINKEIQEINKNEHLDICKIIEYEGFEKDLPKRKKMVDFRVKLIQYFVNLATKNFIENLEAIDKGEYSNELLDQDDFKVEEALRNFNIKYIFNNREILSAELTGSSVINGLLDIFIDLYFNDDESKRSHIKGITSKSIIRIAIHEQLNSIIKDSVEFNCFDIIQLDDYRKLRIIVDFVSGMTDQYAVKLYQRLSGQKL